MRGVLKEIADQEDARLNDDIIDFADDMDAAYNSDPYFREGKYNSMSFQEITDKYKTEINAMIELAKKVSDAKTPDELLKSLAELTDSYVRTALFNMVQVKMFKMTKEKYK